MRPHAGLDRYVVRSTQVGREDDVATTADAVAKCLQAVGGGGAVPSESAGLTAGRRFAALVQRAASVPSRCSSAFEIFWAAGSDDAFVLDGACA
jgi:hypothetical protein